MPDTVLINWASMDKTVLVGLHLWGDRRTDNSLWNDEWENGVCRKWEGSRGKEARRTWELGDRTTEGNALSEILRDAGQKGHSTKSLGNNKHDRAAWCPWESLGEGMVGRLAAFVLKGIGAHFSCSYNITQSELVINTKITVRKFS